MFDIGWTELLLIGVLILFMFGPEDIPKIMYNLGKVLRRFRYMRYALSSQFEDFMQGAEAKAKIREPVPAKPATAEIMDDESDADEHLIDLMPVPETIESKPVDIDHEPAKPDPTADRG
jgi:sec-independent protein translocase protein TatB